MEPSWKSPALEKSLETMFGKPRVDCIKQNICMTCDNTNVQFRDTISRKEYSISGMCQVCQDNTYGDCK